MVVLGDTEVALIANVAMCSIIILALLIIWIVALSMVRRHRDPAR